MIVVDASVMTNALIADGLKGIRAREELRRDTTWAAPEHFTAEVYSAVRGGWLGGKTDEERATAALESISMASVITIPTLLLMRRMWDLRSNLTGYDAAYIAAAEILGAVLVTADAALTMVPGARCDVRLAVPND